MILEILLAATMNFAPAETVYLFDTQDRTVRRCKCIHLPDFNEYCDTGGDRWKMFARHNVEPTEASARAHLKADIERQIRWLQSINVENLSLLEGDNGW